jgi:uncharacterized protein YcnI
VKRRILTTCLLVTAFVVMTAIPAFAHLEADPDSVAPGTTAALGFNMEHGCGVGENSRAVELAMKVPSNVDIVTIPAVAGWTGSRAGAVVTWRGGPQPAHTPLKFSLVAKIPNTPGVDLVFPAFETCQTGTINWIEKTIKGEAEPEHPAPVVSITGKATTSTGATTTTVAPAKSSSSHTGLIVAVVVIVLVVIGVIAFLLRRRRTT